MNLRFAHTIYVPRGATSFVCKNKRSLMDSQLVYIACGLGCAWSELAAAPASVRC